MLTDLSPVEQGWTQAIVRGRLEHHCRISGAGDEVDRRVRSHADGDWCDSVEVQDGACPSRALARAHEATVGHRIVRSEAGSWTYVGQPGHTRGSGADFTPPRLIRFMVRATLGRWLARPERTRVEVEGVRILDPACGAGMFLAESLDCLIEWLRERGEQPDPAALATRHLVGLDVDPRAVATARRVLALRVREHGARLEPACLEAAIRVGNTLVPGTLDGRFDVVVGNPPYVFGEFVDAKARADWATHFTLGRAGQPDAFKLFYERTAGDLLRAGGCHGFVVPDAILGRDGHADLRRWLLRELHLVRACHVGAVFRRGGVRPDGVLTRAQRVGVSGVVIVGERGGVRRDADSIEVDQWTSQGPKPGHRVSARLAARLDGSPWVLHAPEGWLGSQGLRSRMERSGATVADLLLPGTGGLTRGEELGKQALEPRGSDPTQVPIYSGDCVRRYRSKPPRLQGPRGAVDKPEAVYRGPKVLYVKTGAGPVAACVRDDFPALQSVYLLHAQRDVPVRVVVGFLCSALVTAYIWYQWTSAKRQQPQLTLGNLRSIPLPRMTAGQAAHLSEAVRAVEEADEVDLPERERRVDELVAQMYGISLESSAEILAPALDAIPSSQRPSWWGNLTSESGLGVR